MVRQRLLGALQRAARLAAALPAPLQGYGQPLERAALRGTSHSCRDASTFLASANAAQASASRSATSGVATRTGSDAQDAPKEAAEPEPPESQEPPNEDEDEDNEKGEDLFGVLFRVVAVTSVAIALAINVQRVPFLGNMSTNLMLLDGNDQMRSAGLQRIRIRFVPEHEPDLLKRDAPRKLVAMIASEERVGVRDQLYQTLQVLLVSGRMKEAMRDAGLDEALQARMAVETDETMREAAEALLLSRT